ncbi:MAG TPA: helix-turn-helix domain-containing protein [Thermomonospora sp.]|nr:helix-turn-helix domain-containing protein [Thermomonospora sp.]
MTRNPALRDHVAAGLLDVAAAVLADRGEAASMTDIAEAAGVARATLYRYFPSRDALVAALTEAAFADLAERIADARLDTVPAAEALARLTRAVVAATAKYRALGMFTKSPETARKAEERMLGPVQALFRRGVDEGDFRTDLPAATLLEVYVALLEGAAARVIAGRFGVEEASSAMTAVFLDGVRSRS